MKKLKIAVMLVMAIYFGFTYKVNAVVDITPPTAPSNLTATAVSPSQINLCWSASWDNVKVARYLIYRGATMVGYPTANTYPYGQCFANYGLAANTQYCYTIKAIDSAGNLSVASSQKCVITRPDTIPPTVPTNLIATVVSPTQINLAWTASLDNVRVVGYWVYRQTYTDNAHGFSYKTNYQIRGLSTKTQYCFVVRAIDTSGNLSMASSQQCAITCTDVDGDGFNTCTGPNHDCNDNNPDIHPGATEICDGLDNDCNGQADAQCTIDIFSVPEYDGNFNEFDMFTGFDYYNSKKLRVNGHGFDAGICSYSNLPTVYQHAFITFDLTEFDGNWNGIELPDLKVFIEKLYLGTCFSINIEAITVKLWEISDYAKVTDCTVSIYDATETHSPKGCELPERTYPDTLFELVPSGDGWYSLSQTADQELLLQLLVDHMGQKITFWLDYDSQGSSFITDERPYYDCRLDQTIWAPPTLSINYPE